MNTTTLLPLMMAALYYDPAILPAERLNDFNRKCSDCNYKVRCQHDLESGEAYRTYKSYCPNAEMLYLLQPWLEQKFSFK
jgi:hypothetical protein